MKIKAIQKTTLIDYPGKIACTLFLFGCNFRCGFCHNPELVIREESEDLNKKDILDFLKRRKNQLEGVCITGGEPLLTLEKDFLDEIKKLGYEIKLDTNGAFPKRLKRLIDEKLIDFVSMDVKADRENYEKITNVKVNFKKIEESMKIISNLMDYEFRTTVLESLHDKKSFERMCSWMRDVIGKKPKKFCLQGFKNKGKLIDKNFSKVKDTKEKYLNDLKDIAEKYFEEVEVRI